MTNIHSESDTDFCPETLDGKHALVNTSGTYEWCPWCGHDETSGGPDTNPNTDRLVN